MECTLIITHWLTYFYIIKVEDSHCVVLIALLIECKTVNRKVWGTNPANSIFLIFKNLL